MKVKTIASCYLWLLASVLCCLTARASIVSVLQTEVVVVFNLSKPVAEYQHKNSALNFLQSLNKGQLPQSGYLVLQTAQSFPNGFNTETFERMAFRPKVFKKFNNPKEALVQGLNYYEHWPIKEQKYFLYITDQNLLTANDPVLEQLSRKVLLGELLMAVSKSGVTFNTLALDNFSHSQDIFKISLETKGSFDITRDSNPLSTLPIQNNRFVVDHALEEIILSFDSKDKDVRLLLPTGQTALPNEQSDGLNWQKLNHHHTVVIKKPLPGIWTIEGKADRAKIELVSDLKLEIMPLQGNVFLGEVNVIQAFFSKQGEAIIDPNFTQQVKMKVKIRNEALSDTMKLSLNDNGEGLDRRGLDGIFTADFMIFDKPGIYDIAVVATGIGIKRERHQKIFVHDYPLQIKPKYDITSGNLSLSTQISDQFRMLKENFDLALVLTETDGRLRRFLFEKFDDKNWRIDYPLDDVADIERIYVQLDGKTKGGRSIMLQFPKFDLDRLKQQARLEFEALALERVNKEDVVLGRTQLFSNERRKEVFVETLVKDNPKFLPHWKRKYKTFEQEVIATIIAAHGTVVLNKDDDKEWLAMDSVSNLEVRPLSSSHLQTKTAYPAGQQVVLEAENAPSDIINESSSMRVPVVDGETTPAPPPLTSVNPKPEVNLADEQSSNGALIVMMIISLIITLGTVALVVALLVIKRKAQKADAETSEDSKAPNANEATTANLDTANLDTPQSESNESSAHSPKSDASMDSQDSSGDSQRSSEESSVDSPKSDEPDNKAQ